MAAGRHAFYAGAGNMTRIRTLKSLLTAKVQHHNQEDFRRVTKTYISVIESTKE